MYYQAALIVQKTPSLSRENRIYNTASTSNLKKLFAVCWLDADVHGRYVNIGGVECSMYSICIWG